MTREFFGRLVKLFDGFRREIDAIDDLNHKGLPWLAKHKLLEAKYEVVMDLLDVQHTDSPLWVNMPFGEKIESMYLLCKTEYEAMETVPNQVLYHRAIDLGGLDEKRV